jgi:hypothetical protein
MILVTNALIAALAIATLGSPKATLAPERPAQKVAAAVPPVQSGAWTTPVAEGFRFVDGLHEGLHGAADGRFVARLPVDGRELVVRLRPFRACASDVVVEVGAAKRRPAPELSAALAAIVHLEGEVEGFAGSSCYLAFAPTGHAGWIELGDGRGHFTLRRVGSDAPGLCAGPCEFVRTSGTSAPDVPTCGGAHEHGDSSGGSGEGGVAGSGSIAPGARRLVDLAIDMDFDMRSIFPDNASAASYAGALVGAVSAIYRRDCDASIRISYLRVLDTADDLFNEPDPLVPFRDYWNANGAAIDRDLFTLLTGRRNLPYGGVAWLDAACGAFGYSVNGYLNGRFADPVATSPGNWDINVVAHELGHNLGTRHTHDYGLDGCASGTVQRGTIMSYCHVVSGASSNIDLRFHRGTSQRIESFISGAPCLAVDCDGDGIDDATEIAANPGLDINFDGLIDACQDCNANGIPDPVEIASGAQSDADGDQLPDSCETDCDADGVPDSVEINADMALDRSRDGRIDACEDCDGDGVPDHAELAGSKSRWVASAGDNLLRELDARSGVLRRTVTAGSEPATDLAFGPDGQLYATIGTRVWRLSPMSASAATPWSVALAAETRSIAVAPDGRAAVLMQNGRIDLLTATGEVATTFVAAGAYTDARDLVFRTAPGGAVEAIVTRSGGIVGRFAWPSGAASAFADLSAIAPGLRGAYAMADGSVLVAASALNAVYRIDPTGATATVWDVDNAALVNGAYAIADAGDGRAVLVTGPSSSSTINGFNLATGYTERTYRVYPADAPQATAVAIAPASASDLNGNLVPDECESSPADLDGDGDVDAADLASLLGSWGACAGCPGDLDGDGAVGAADLAILLGSWG